MNDDEVIAAISRELAESKQRCARYAEAIEHTRGHLTYIGGPLNDNFLQFNKEQIKLLMKVDGCLDIL